MAKRGIIYIFIIIYAMLALLLFCSSERQLESKNNNTGITNINSIYENKYNSCLKESVDASLLGEEFQKAIISLNNYLKNYNVFVSYEELDTNYYYGYRDNEVIYGASLIKLVDALYILDNSIDINTTIELLPKYYSKYNKGLSKRNISEKISIDDLVNYALSLSDNGAHTMLIDYIGLQNLKNYGLSLGAKRILQGGDNFGFQTAKDTSIYLKRMFQLSKENENAQKFSSYMINDFYNYLSVEQLLVSHKYGHYKNYFHNIGIIYDDHPYSISVLTTYGKANYKQIINDVSKEVFKVHTCYWDSFEQYCEVKAKKNT